MKPMPPKLFTEEDLSNALIDACDKAYSNGYAQGVKDATEWVLCAERLPENDIVVDVALRNCLRTYKDWCIDGEWECYPTLVYAWRLSPPPVLREDAKDTLIGPGVVDTAGGGE